MKRILLAFAVAIFAVSESFSQTVVSTDFENTSGGGLPAGWTQVSAASPGWQTTSAAVNLYFGTASGTPLGTKYALVNDYNGGSTLSSVNSNDVLKTPVFSLAGITNPYLTYDRLFWGAWLTSAADTEHLSILISTNGGTSWAATLQTDTFHNSWINQYVSLAAYAGMSNLVIGIKYDDMGKQIIGAAIDNVMVFGQKTNDIAVQYINMGSIAGNGTTVKFHVYNKGTSTVTSLNANYSVNGSSPVTQTFSSLNIAPFGSADISFTTTLAGITSGAGLDSVTVNVSQVNSTTDDYTADNTKVKYFAPASSSVQRNGLIEEFSSSTCVPCAGFNATWDPLMESLSIDVPSTHVNVVKYQMNWPSPGNDSSYNQDGVDRRTYYGVNAIPEHFVNGQSSTAALTTTGLTDEFNNSKADVAFFDMSGTYTVTMTDSMYVTLSITPHVTITGNYTVYLAAVERHYVNPYATTTQSDYYHVMRMMFPNGNGNSVTSWTDGTAKNYSFANKFVVGHPEQMNNHFWGDPGNSDIVAFIQDNSTNDILQSIVIPATGTAAVKGVTNSVSSVVISPNPANDFTTLHFNLSEATNVSIEVLDVAGRTVSTMANDVMGVGNHNITINTSNIAAGYYTIRISTGNGAITQPLSVVK
jgi:hypothetical protein